MAQIRLTVAIADDYLDNILEVAQNLHSAGMQVSQIMDRVGVIVGSSEAAQVANLAQVRGVESVEASHSYQLSPPDSKVQ